MQIYLDTANIEEIKRGIAAGCVSGVTTNPSIIAREGKSLQQCISEIVALDPLLTVFMQVVSNDRMAIVSEARDLVKLAPNVVIKLPMTIEGLAAIKMLAKEGIRSCVTIIFSLNQAIVACAAGADFIAPYVGRLDDISADGIGLVKSIRTVLKEHNMKTQIIAASIRNPQTVAELFMAGCDIVTMSGDILDLMFKHPLTEAGLKKFAEDWKKVPQ